MIDKLALFFKKYFVPGIFLIVGLFILILGIKNNQSGVFMFSAVLMLAAGAISVLYSLGKLKPMMVYIIGGVMGLVAILSIYMSYESVSTTNTFNENRDRCQELAKQNLTDISYIQKSYRDKNGVYLSEWDELVSYVKNGTVPTVISEGVVPSTKITADERDYLYGDNRPIDVNMTEIEAHRLSKWVEGPRYAELFKGFKRDTIEVSILESKFQTKAYVSNRENLGFGKFYPDSLPFIPYTKGDKLWTLEVKDSINFSGMTGPSIFIHGYIPFGKTEGAAENIMMSLGNINTFEHTGSWEKE